MNGGVFWKAEDIKVGKGLMFEGLESRMLTLPEAFESTKYSKGLEFIIYIACVCIKERNKQIRRKSVVQAVSEL